MSEVPPEPERELEEEDVEAALRALVPGPSRLDRDRLMFEAGALSTRGSAWRHRAWPAAAAVLALALAGESWLMAVRPTPRVVERLVVVREPSATSPSRSAAPQSGRADTPLVPTSDGLRPDRADELSDAGLPMRWVTVADSHRLRGDRIRSGFEGPPGPTRPDANAGGQAGSNGRSPASVGALRRLELEKWLNPGDQS
jgi:hypothetical protein